MSHSTSNALFMTGTAALLCGIILLFAAKTRRRERLIYWSTWTVGGVLISAALLYRGVGTAMAALGASAFGAVFYAYLRTPYLKIGNRTYAFSIPDSSPAASTEDSQPVKPRQAPIDSYLGVVTARNFWWLLAGVTGVLAYSLYAFGWNWATLAFTAVLTLFALVCGLDDATRDMAIVRRQYVPAFFAASASALMWGIPSIAYFCGYQFGQRWPLAYGHRDAARYRYQQHLHGDQSDEADAG